jgi:hypothetical protein
MSTQAWEHHHHAGRHHELAAYHHNQAAKHDEAGDHERAAHHAYLALGHLQHATQHGAEAAKLHADLCSDKSSAPQQDFANKSAA